MTEILIDTSRGPARAHLSLPDGGQPAAALVLGHGAGGGVGAPDLLAVRQGAVRDGLAVALVEQPYRVAGRRSPPPAPVLDEAWTTVVAELASGPLAGMALVTGGRSSGARVACRTAAATGAAGVLCLAFPLVPPQRAGSTRPAVSRLPELVGVTVPTLVVQGVADRFGMPPPASGRTVIPVAGDHGLKADTAAVSRAVSEWLSAVVAGLAPRRERPEATRAVGS